MTAKSIYQEKGSLSPLSILTEEEVAPYRSSFDDLERQLGPEVCTIGLVNVHEEHEFIWQLASHNKILDLLETIIGPDIVLIGTHCFCKYPAADEPRFVAWHQDTRYWGFDPPLAHTIWLAIDDSDVQNGAMRVIPGSHKQGLRTHGESKQSGNLLSVNQEIDEATVNAESAVDLLLKAGQASLHHGMLIHGSNPNRSQRRRCGIVLRYGTPDLRIVDEPLRRATWCPVLLRGEDRFGTLPIVGVPSFS